MLIYAALDFGFILYEFKVLHDVCVWILMMFVSIVEDS